VKALFVELPAFERHRSEYLDDEAFSALQAGLLADPEAGDVIRDTGGLLKVRVADGRRGKGKRGGLRVITTGGRQVASSGSSLCTEKVRSATSPRSNARSFEEFSRQS
jgi:hypothetical protein